MSLVRAGTLYQSGNRVFYNPSTISESEIIDANRKEIDSEIQHISTHFINAEQAKKRIANREYYSIKPLEELEKGPNAVQLLDETKDMIDSIASIAHPEHELMFYWNYGYEEKFSGEIVNENILLEVKLFDLYKELTEYLFKNYSTMEPNRFEDLCSRFLINTTLEISFDDNGRINMDLPFISFRGKYSNEYMFRNRFRILELNAPFFPMRVIDVVEVHHHNIWKDLSSSHLHFLAFHKIPEKPEAIKNIFRKIEYGLFASWLFKNYDYLSSSAHAVMQLEEETW